MGGVKCKVIACLLHGIASWYGPGFHGHKAADGSTFDQMGMTAASRTLPLGTNVLVVNTDNHRAVLVKITDRGPYVDDRVLDVSRGAAEALGFDGLAPVDIMVIP